MGQQGTAADKTNRTGTVGTSAATNRTGDSKERRQTRQIVLGTAKIFATKQNNTRRQQEYWRQTKPNYKTRTVTSVRLLGPVRLFVVAAAGRDQSKTE